MCVKVAERTFFSRSFFCRLFSYLILAFGHAFGGLINSLTFVSTTNAIENCKFFFVCGTNLCGMDGEFSFLFNYFRYFVIYEIEERH